VGSEAGIALLRLAGLTFPIPLLLGKADLGSFWLNFRFAHRPLGKKQGSSIPSALALTIVALRIRLLPS
jgi:hypothetical protein